MLNSLIKVVYAQEASNLPNYPTPANGVPRGVINLRDSNLNLGQIIGAILPYIYVGAGLILLLMLISGGITLMTSAGSPDKSKAGFGRITGALIGFVIIFVSYFVAKIVEVILGVKFM
jgi:hypothetical protein